jgi:DNA invertase Pin-like site-specific DNA recombinase
VQASTRKAAKVRRLDELSDLQKGDALVTAEMSRLGRSVGQIAILVDELLHNGVRLIFIKENMELNGARSMQSKVMVTMFSLFAEIERDLISERTKEGADPSEGRGQAAREAQGQFRQIQA